MKKVFIIAAAVFAFLNAKDANAGLLSNIRARRQSGQETQVVNNYTAVSDIAYGSDPLQKLDVYTPKNANGKMPLVIFIHGGGWAIGNKTNVLHGKEDYFTGQGYVFASINYRLSPVPEKPSDPSRIMYPVHEEDCAAAIAYLLKNASRYNIDTSHVALMGHSAGAQLATLVALDGEFLAAYGYDTSVIKVLVSLDTEGYDLSTYMTDARPEARGLYANAFGEDPKIWAKASAVNYINAGNKIANALFVYQGDKEKRGALARQIADKLNASGHHAEIYGAKGLNHAQVNEESGQAGTELNSAIQAFLNQNL